MCSQCSVNDQRISETPSFLDFWKWWGGRGSETPLNYIPGVTGGHNLFYLKNSIMACSVALWWGTLEVWGGRGEGGDCPPPPDFPPPTGVVVDILKQIRAKPLVQYYVIHINPYKFVSLILIHTNSLFVIYHTNLLNFT
jgi:hypothetical protein